MRKVFFIIPILFIWAYAQNHYEFANIPSPQNVDTPFQITIYYKDAGGNIIDTTAKVPITTNHGSNIIYMNTTKSTSEILFAHGIAQEPIEVRQATNDMQLIVGSNSSNSFVVNHGVLNRVQILLPGEEATPGIAPGKHLQPTSQKSGIPFDSVYISTTDKWWNVFSQTTTVTLSSTDTFAVLTSQNIVNGTKMDTMTFRTVACPLPSPPIVYQKAFASATGLFSDSSTVIVASGPYNKLIAILPGEKSVPGSVTGKTGDAVVTAYKPFSFSVYACDAAWNEAYPIPSNHRVSLWCDAGAQFYKTDTVMLKQGGTTLHITMNPDPGSGPVVYTVRPMDIDDSSKNGNASSVQVNRVPDSLVVAADKDTIVLGIEMDITASAFGGGKPYSNTQIHFNVVSVEGNGTLSDTTGTTDIYGMKSVTFTGKQPGAVYVKAWSDLDPTVMDSVRVVVVTKERISFYPNPWSRTKTPTATILYTLESDVSSVSLLIADVSGNIVKKVEYKEPDIQTLSGPHYIVWDGKNMKGEKVASGIYVIRVRATGEESFKRSALLLP
jgi:hypothetical protein